MARRGRQCVVKGCWRRARSGQLVCLDHRGTGLAKEMGREVAKLEREVRALLLAANPQEAKDAGHRFRRRLERGEFAALFAGKMQALFETPSDEEPLRDEIAALRIAMMRLLLEENDAAALAKGLSQVSHATARLLREQRSLEGERVTAGMLERSMTKLEEATRELSEDEVLEIETRKWKREVGWTKEDEKAWRSPENQRRVLNQWVQEALEEKERQWAWEAARAASSAGAERDEKGGGAGDHGDSAIAATAVGSKGEHGGSPLPMEREERAGEHGGSPTPAATVGSRGEHGGSPVPGEGGGGIPPYSNELERLFWESDDPFAYEKELRRQIEEGKSWEKQGDR